MLAAMMLKWWYTDGWHNFLAGFSLRLKNAADFFSLKLLVENMFAPFRQISANATGGNDVGSKLVAFSDRLFSRAIGTVVRFFLLIFGVIAIALEMIFGAIIAVLWPLAPVVMAVFVIMFIAGVSL